MKLFPYIKKNLISFIRDGKVVIISFLIFPMIMAYIYGTMQENLFSGKSSFKPITVEFQYDEKSKQGEILTLILKDKSVKSFISTDFDEEPKCQVSITKDFKSISIKKFKGSDNEVDMIKGFMKTFSESINQYSMVMDNVDKLSLNSKEKGELVNKLMSVMSENSRTSSIVQQVVPGYRSLGAREYYTISMFSFTSIMLIMVLVRGFYKDRKCGVVRRSFSTPNSKETYLVGYLVSSFILAFLINLIYVSINRYMKIAFLESIFSNIFLVFLQSILQTAVAGTVISFIKSEQVVNSIMTIIIIVPAVIGGVFFSADFIEIKILKVVSDLAPNSLILNSYKNLSITQGISGAENQIIIAALLSLVLIIVSFLKVRSSWEE